MTRRPVFAGLVLVALGLVLLLDELGSLDAGSLVATWWPLVVIAAGAVQVLVPPRSPGGGAVVLAVGAVLLLWRLGVVDDLALLWPVLLLTLGSWLLLGRTRRHRLVTVGGTTVGEEIDVVSVFGDRAVRLATGAFSGGSVVTVLGDADLDLTAGVPTKVAELDGITIFGDLRLVVPAHWSVRVSGPTIFGEVRVADASVPPDGSVPPELRLELVTVFGDVEVQRRSVLATTGEVRNSGAGANRV